MVTAWPAAWGARQSGAPMNPVPPVTTIRMPSPPGRAWLLAQAHCEIKTTRGQGLRDDVDPCEGPRMTMPLDGIRVIDWTIWQQGPVASAMLADLGAD